MSKDRRQCINIFKLLKEYNWQPQTVELYIQLVKKKEKYRHFQTNQDLVNCFHTPYIKRWKKDSNHNMDVKKEVKTIKDKSMYMLKIMHA
jgi:hypothetical protein